MIIHTMLSYLKKQPLVGLTLALAGALVLAHFANKILDDYFVDYLERDPGEFFVTFAAVVIPSVLSYRFRRPIWAFILRNRWKLSTAVVLIAATFSYFLYLGNVADAEQKAVYEKQAKDEQIARAAAAVFGSKPGQPAPKVYLDENGRTKK